MSRNQDEPAGIDFLDFLFTVAISVGLTPELIQQKGLLSEDWATGGRWPCGDESINLAVFVLGFVNLTLSWFGYHASIKKKPLNYSSIFGMFRFLFDVVLVVLYGVILIKYKSLSLILGLMFVIYFMFVIWDVLKIGEHWALYKSKKATNFLQRYRREFVSLAAFIGVALTCYLHFVMHVNQWLVVTMAMFFAVFYRVNKYFSTWERLFKVTGDV